MIKTIYRFFFWAICLSPGLAWGQDPAVEVWPYMGQEQVDSARIIEILRYSYNNRLNHTDTAIYYAYRAKEFAQRINLIGGISRAHRFLGFAYEQTSLPDSARFHFWRAISTAQSPVIIQAELARAYSALVSHYRAAPNPPIDSCLYYLTLIDRLTEKTGNFRQVLYREYGELYEQLEQYEKAEEYYRKLLEYAQENELSTYISIGYYYLVAINRLAGDQIGYSNYLNDYLRLRGKLDRETLENRHHAGLLLLGNDSLEQAIPTLQANLKTHLALEHFHSAITTLFYLSKAYAKTGDYAAALAALEQQILLSGDYTNVGAMILTYQEAYQLAKRMGEWEKAISYHNQFTELRNQVYRNEQRARMEELAVAFEAEKKEKALRIQSLELKEKTNERNLLIGSSIFLLVIAGLVYLGAKQILRTRKQLARQKAHMQEQAIQHLTRQKKLTEIKAMAKGQEVERLRVAKDLQQSLGVILNEVETSFGTLFPVLDTTPELAQKSSRYLQEAKDEMQRIAHDLHPEILIKSGLPGSLQALGEQIRARGLEAKLDIGGLSDMEDPARSSTVYRIVQEIIQNTFKHANATKISIQARLDQEYLILIVGDDGKGMSPQQPAGEGIGLKNIQSRMDYLNGKLEIRSSLGTGTTYYLRIPNGVRIPQPKPHSL